MGKLPRPIYAEVVNGAVQSGQAYHHSGVTGPTLTPAYD